MCLDEIIQECNSFIWRIWNSSKKTCVDEEIKNKIEIKKFYENISNN